MPNAARRLVFRAETEKKECMCVEQTTDREISLGAPSLGASALHSALPAEAIGVHGYLAVASQPCTFFVLWRNQSCFLAAIASSSQTRAVALIVRHQGADAALAREIEKVGQTGRRTQLCVGRIYDIAVDLLRNKPFHQAPGIVFFHKNQRVLTVHVSVGRVVSGAYFHRGQGISRGTGAS